MNDIVHATLKAILIGTEMMNRIPLLEKVARDSQLEAINWKEQFESAQIDMEDLQESKKQLSKASEENRELKDLLSQKEVYAGDLVQSLTQAQEDLQILADNVRALESSHASLQASYNSALAENEELKNEIADWEKDYETLEEKSDVEPVAASQVETVSVDAPAQIEPVDIDVPASVPQTSQSPVLII
ncbi:intracellular protein transport protein USO1-like [Nicotiana sylvestris]|uniref:intracellular protein transport protein USO1-like n=1 Tax=Nicotiana sylvestris TaxID=4096 RepID=UPI00388C34DF